MAPKPNGPTRTPGTGNFNGVSPVILSSSCVVAANNSAIPDSGQLSYPFRKAIVVEEIRYTMTLLVDGGAHAANIGAIVSTKLALGQKFLTKDFVPVWLLGTVMSHLDEQGPDTTATPPKCVSSYRWRLPVPLYVEAGQVLSSVFARGADGQSGNVNVQVSYVGKTVAPNQPRPSVIAVPFVASFVSVLGQVYAQSNENHLFNIFDYPLRIQRLTGRLLSLQPQGVDPIVALEGLTPAVAGGAITLLMDDSWGGKMVGNNTGPGDVFDCLRGGWTVDTIMPAKGMYEARAWNIPATQQVHIAMIGHRDEVL